jgi:hypothetical protein
VTVILFEASLVQPPCDNLQTAVYSVVAEGFTVTVFPVRPFDQTIIPPSQPVANSFVASPAQTIVFSVLIVGLLGLPTVIITSFDFGLSQLPTLHIAE